MSKSLQASSQFKQVMEEMAQLSPADHFEKLLLFSWELSCTVMNTDSCDAEFASKLFPGLSVRAAAWGLGQQAFDAFALLDSALSLRCPECEGLGHGEPHELYGGVIAHPAVTMAARILKQGSTVANEDYDDVSCPPDMVIAPELMLAVLRDPDCAPFLASCEKPSAAQELRELQAAVLVVVATRQWPPPDC
jgi:hypothetical protein